MRTSLRSQSFQQHLKSWRHFLLTLLLCATDRFTELQQQLTEYRYSLLQFAQLATIGVLELTLAEINVLLFLLDAQQQRTELAQPMNTINGSPTTVTSRCRGDNL